jgi:hypothetical protein
MRKKETLADMVPVRIDRNTVVYPKREAVEARGGVEGYVKWFLESRTTSRGDINALAEW